MNTSIPLWNMPHHQEDSFSYYFLPTPKTLSHEDIIKEPDHIQHILTMLLKSHPIIYTYLGWTLLTTMNWRVSSAIFPNLRTTLMMILGSNRGSGMSTWMRRRRGRRGGRGLSGSPTTMTSRMCRKRGGLELIPLRINRPTPIHQHPYLPNIRGNFKVKRIPGPISSLMRRSNPPSLSGNTTELKWFFQSIPILSNNRM